MRKSASDIGQFPGNSETQPPLPLDRKKCFLGSFFNPRSEQMTALRRYIILALVLTCASCSANLDRAPFIPSDVAAIPEIGRFSRRSRMGRWGA